jgi:RNA polymerase sigma-70 factor (ECF subfamily)
VPPSLQPPEPAGRPATTDDVPRRFAAGDEEAARVVAARVERIVAFRGFGVPPEDRRDIRQDVVMQVLLAVRREGFDFGQGFWGFVETVAARRVIDWLRARRPVEELDPDRPDPAAGTVEDRLLAREREARGRAVIARLDDRCRELIARHAGQGQSYRDIAAALGVSEGALRVQLHRCVKRAREMLLDDGAGQAEDPNQ